MLVAWCSMSWSNTSVLAPNSGTNDRFPSADKRMRRDEDLVPRAIILNRRGRLGQLYMVDRRCSTASVWICETLDSPTPVNRLTSCMVSSCW